MSDDEKTEKTFDAQAGFVRSISRSYREGSPVVKLSILANIATLLGVSASTLVVIVGKLLGSNAAELGFHSVPGIETIAVLLAVGGLASILIFGLSAFVRYAIEDVFGSEPMWFTLSRWTCATGLLLRCLLASVGFEITWEPVAALGCVIGGIGLLVELVPSSSEAVANPSEP